MSHPERGRLRDHDEWVPGEREVGSPTEVTLLFQARARALLSTVWVKVARPYAQKAEVTSGTHQI